jgi:hypothetical protein
VRYADTLAAAWPASGRAAAHLLQHNVRGEADLLDQLLCCMLARDMSRRALLDAALLAHAALHEFLNEWNTRSRMQTHTGCSAPTALFCSSGIAAVSVVRRCIAAIRAAACASDIIDGESLLGVQPIVEFATWTSLSLSLSLH